METVQHQEEKLSKYERAQARYQERGAEQGRQNRKKTLKRLLLWAVVAVFVAGSVYGLVRIASQVSVSDPNAKQLSIPISADDWSKGNLQAKVTLLEYSDFQCPACGSYYPILKKVVQDYGDRVRFVYRHYPIRQIHPNAELAARTAEAAGKQGKFWEMHDKLFENQSKWSSKSGARSDFEGYAGELGLNIEQFKKDIDSQELKDKVNAQYVGGNESGVSGTPSFFLNGSRIQNPGSYEQFKSVIDAALTNQS